MEPLPQAFAETDIDGVHYSLFAMMPDKVMDHGNALISLFSTAALGKAALAGDGVAIGGAVMAAVLQNMASPPVKAVIADLWKDALADGKPLAGTAWKGHFTAKTGSMMRFIAWALEAQFADFFGSLTGVLRDVGERLKQSAARAQATAEAQTSPSG